MLQTIDNRSPVSSDSFPTWERIHRQLAASAVLHKPVSLPCNVGELQWIRSETARVIDYFDQMCWSILELASRLQRALDCEPPSHVPDDELRDCSSLPRRNTRLDALIRYLTPGEQMDFRISQRLTDLAACQLRRLTDGQAPMASTTDIYTAGLVRLLRGWATGIRRGSIGPLGELERRVVLLLDALTAGNVASAAPPKERTSRGRGRPVNPVNEARDKRLRQLCERLEDQHDGVTPQQLLAAARQDVLLQELVSRLDANLSYEVCRNVISPVPHRRSGNRKKHQQH